MKKGFFNVKTIAGLGLLTAMVVVLQLISNYVQFGPVSITLSLFPIAVGAMLYGPIGGFFLGLINGVIVLTAPSTISFFFAFTPLGTIAVCLLKTSVAGLVAGFIFKLYHRNIKVEFVAAILLVPILILIMTGEIFVSMPASLNWLKNILRFSIALTIVLLVFKGLVKPSKNSVILLTSLSVPIINTGLFIVGALTVFIGKIEPMAASSGQNYLSFLIFAFIGWNFLLEFAINALLASAFHSTYKSLEKNFSRKGR